MTQTNTVRKMLYGVGQKISVFLLGHLVLSILVPLTAIIAIGATLFTEWLCASHTLALSGGQWVAFVAVYPLLFFGGIWLDRSGPWKYTNENDIKNRLCMHFERIAPKSVGGSQHTLRYRTLDWKYRLKRGSAKRYLAQAAKESGWNVCGVGPETLRGEFQGHHI